MMEIGAPLLTDEPWIRQLLILCDLPEDDITPEQLRHFLVLKEKGQEERLWYARQSAVRGWSHNILKIQICRLFAVLGNIFDKNLLNGHFKYRTVIYSLLGGYLLNGTGNK